MRATLVTFLLALAAGGLAGPALTGPAPGAAVAVSGYEVADVDYTLSGADPAALAAVSFSLRPAGARTAQVRLTAGGAWHGCAVTGGRATCSLPAGVTLAAAERLEIAAA